MYKIDFNEPIHVHFIGIGGISMSGLADVLLKEGFKISGSDSKESELTKALESRGAVIYIGQRASNIKGNENLVVYTAAIHPDNPEYAAAVAAGIPMMTRAELLGQIMANYTRSIAVSGTHGKTTTTSMMAHILLAANTDPTISIGGMLDAIGGNIRVGSSDVFLTEACEYTNSFFSFYPKYNIILNVEEDHLDFFKDIDDIRHSFKHFAENTAHDGAVIINADIDDYNKLLSNIKCPAFTFGFDQTADVYASDISYDQGGCASFTAHISASVTQLDQTGPSASGNEDSTCLTVKLNVPGRHNVANALSAIACSKAMGISDEAIKEGLMAFGGTKRRFELKGHLGNITVIDDYAHHPTEIEATLKAALNLNYDRVVCVFQPHTYTRTKAFFDQFAKALSLADIVVTADIYAARETDTLGISSEMLSQAIASHGTESYYFPSFDEIENFLLKKCTNNDLLITMGAGDVYKIGENLLGL